MKIQSRVTQKKSGKVTEETRYYLASQELGERTAAGWMELSRQHWGGVEIRNHWRRDASAGEDWTRLRHSRALVNLALVWSVALRLWNTLGEAEWLPENIERCAAHPALALSLLQTRL